MKTAAALLLGLIVSSPIIAWSSPEGSAATKAAATSEPVVTRTFTFSYEIVDAQFPSVKAVDLYVPVPSEQDGQRIIDSSVKSSLSASVKREERFGNTYYHIRRPAGSSEPINASFQWTVSREAIGADGRLAAEQEKLAPFLQSNRLVPVGHEVLDPILAEIHAARATDSPEDTARAIYDWVVDNVEYKKVGTGWGNGDTFWACSERYGNCTDFHALFTALARSEGIPSRFEIGFPVPMDRDSGSIGGYHCWVQFYLPDRGWVPIDASEAAKHPKLREQLYGSHPADRIHFTTGRDLRFTQAHEKTPLNYFIYPYVEIDGQPWNEKVATRFHFEVVEPG